MLADGKVLCWGYGNLGRLGGRQAFPDPVDKSIGDDEVPSSGETAGVLSAAEVAAGLTVEAIACRGASTCALTSAGTVRCWGSGQYGRLGYGNTNTVGAQQFPYDAGDVPVLSTAELDSGLTVVHVSTGHSTACVILSDNQVRCWGQQALLALGYQGLPSTENIGDNEPPHTAGNVPVLSAVERSEDGTTVSSIHMGQSFSCALLSTGACRCWGNATRGELGRGLGGQYDAIGFSEPVYAAGDTPVLSPAELAVGHSIALMDNGEYFSCALTAAGSIRCWGQNEAGQLGLGHTRSIGDDEQPHTAGFASVLTQSQSTAGVVVVGVVAGGDQACAVFSSTRVRCWGYNGNGVLGIRLGSWIGDNELPSSVATSGVLSAYERDVLGRSIASLASGQRHICAGLDNGGIRCWGKGESGRLGYNSTANVGITNYPYEVGDVQLGTQLAPPATLKVEQLAPPFAGSGARQLLTLTFNSSLPALPVIESLATGARCGITSTDLSAGVVTCELPNRARPPGLEEELTVSVVHQRTTVTLPLVADSLQVASMQSLPATPAVAAATSADTSFGAAVAWLGDLDRSGSPASVAIGAPGFNGVGGVALRSATGAWAEATLSDGMGGIPNGTVGAIGAQFGAALTWPGDIDRDGNPNELLVGAPGDPAGSGPGTGSVWHLRLQADAPVVTDSTRLATGASLAVQSGCAFGAALAWVGDLADGDTDGEVAAVLVGAPAFSGGAALTNAGAVFVVWIHRRTLAVDRSVRLDPSAQALLAGLVSAGDQFGAALAWSWDLDGDGARNEVLVGAPGRDSARGGGLLLSLQPGTGAPTAVRLLANGANGIPDHTLYSAGQRAGASVAWVGSVAGAAGTEAFLLGSPGGLAGNGSILAFSFPTGVSVSEGDWSLLGTAVGIADGREGLPTGTLPALAALGSSLAVFGDPDGDGVATHILAGAPGSGGGAAWALELDGWPNATAAQRHCPATAPTLDWLQPNATSTFDSDVLITAAGTDWRSCHPLLADTRGFFPLGVSVDPAGATCSWVRVSTDGTRLTCTLSPWLVPPQSISITRPGAGALVTNVDAVAAGSIVAVSSDAPLDQGGGTPLVFFGSHLLPVSVFSGSELLAAGVGRLLIGSHYACDVDPATTSAPQLVRNADGTSLSCAMPAGVGGPHPVRLQLPGGVESDSSVSVTFAAATVDGLSPNSVIFSLTDTYAFAVSGSGFGHSAADVDRVNIGGNDCSSVTWISSTALHCNEVPGNFSSHDVLVWTGGVVSQGGSDRLSFPDEPVVVGVVPSIASTSTPTTISAFGINFAGSNGTLVASVLVGEQPCSSLSVSSNVQLSCRVPPGTGTGFFVTVVTTGGVVSTSEHPLLSYAAPTLSAVDPDVVFSDPSREYTLEVEGSGFGNPGGAQLDSITIGGRSCGKAAVVSDSVIRCVNISAPWANTDVAVAISGQRATASALFEFQPPPSVTSVTPSTGPTVGGTEVAIAGVGFGANAAAIEGISVGGAACPLTAHTSTELRCTLPAGTGTGVPVRVMTRENGAGESSSVFSYSRPRVLGAAFLHPIDSNRVDYAIAGTSSIDVVVDVDDAGVGEAAVGAMHVATAGGEWSSPCPSWTVTRSAADSNQTTQLRCQRLSLATAPTAGGELVVQVVVDGQSSTADPAATLALDGNPTVSAVSPNRDLPTAGVLKPPLVQVVGERLGRTRADVLRVSVGGRACPEVHWNGSSLLLVAIPAGVGSDQALVVTTLGGRSSASSLVAYRQAEVVSLQPEYALTGTGNASFVINGTDFGNEAGDLDNIRVGGQLCARAIWHSAEQVECQGASRSRWASRSVTVTVGGQEGLKNSYFEPVGPPTVKVVSPSVATPGTDLLLVGGNFGYSLADVAAVTVAGAGCTNISYTGPTALGCRMPPEPAELTAQGDPTLLRNVPVVVTTAAGQRNEVPARISFSGSGDPITAAPAHVVAWRPVGQSGSMVVRWAFPQDETMPGVNDISDFEIEVALYPDPAGDTATVDRQALKVPVDDLTAVRTRDGNRVFRFEDFVFSPATASVRVRAGNPTNSGPWSEAFGPVPPNCIETEFLQSHAERHRWSCAECPAGAFCGGSRAANVTALPGFWRVPWSLAGLGFAQCPGKGSCLGYVGAGTTANASAAVATRRLASSDPTTEDAMALEVAPTATNPLRWGDPLAMEGCAEGFAGTMCMSCQSGYTRWGAAGCRKCKSAAWIGLAIFGLAALVAVVVSYLIVSAIRSGAEKTPVGTAAIKVAFSHIQTVAIAASFNLEWPDPVLALFAGMSTATSVSSEVLSLDCAIGNGGNEAEASEAPVRSQFFTKAAIVLALPVLMLLIALLFWFGTPVCCRERSASSAGPTTASRPRPLAVRAQPPLPAWKGNPMAAMHGVSRTEAAGDLPLGAAADNRSLRHRLASQLSISHKFIGVQLSSWDKFLTSTVVILFLVHMSVTTTSLQLLTCRDVVATGAQVAAGVPVAAAAAALAEPGTTAGCSTEYTHRRLVQDLEVCCYDKDAQRSMYGLGIPGLLVYAFGIPVTGALLLWWRRDSLHTHYTKTTLGFLYAGFKDEAYFWESVVMLRKVLVAVIAVALEPMGVTLQTYTALALIFALGLLHAHTWPYTERVLNRLELAALVTAFVTFECGLFISDPLSSSSVRVVATVVIFLCNLLFLGTAVVIIVLDKVGSCLPRRQARLQS